VTVLKHFEKFTFLLLLGREQPLMILGESVGRSPSGCP
jgi:hypothetical protein